MWGQSILLLSTVFLFKCSTPLSDCTLPGGSRGVCLPGDIIIGGLFPMHQRMKNETISESLKSFTCTLFDVETFLGTQVMIHSIEMINKSPMLPNVTLGYEIYDTCGDVTMAIKTALKFMEDQSDSFENCFPLRSDYSNYESNVKAVIGERHSEISIAVARLLTIALIPQISYSSTSEVLSTKSKFPSFLRTIPSDAHQTKAIALLAVNERWNSIGVIGSNDEYGKYGIEGFIDHATKYKLCIAFKEILPALFSQNDTETRSVLNNLMKTINESSGEAVLIFTKYANVQIIIEEAVKLSINRNWIASDAWSTSKAVASLKGIQNIGNVIGFIGKRNVVPGFKEYIHNLKDKEYNSSFFPEYLKNYPPCPNSSLSSENTETCAFYHTRDDLGNLTKKCVDVRFLEKCIDSDGFYSVYLAVNAIANGLKQLLKCNSTGCIRNFNFSAWENHINSFQLLEEIKKVSFTVDNITHVEFDDNGDPSLGYDIVFWKMSKETVNITTIGEYKHTGEIFLKDEFFYTYTNTVVTSALCYKSCMPGFELRPSPKKCCNVCEPCENKLYSLGGMEPCKSCQENEYPSPMKDKCLKKTVVLLQWYDGFAIVLAVFDLTGIIITLLIGVLFARHLNTPVVKGAGGNLCFLTLLSLLASFSSIWMFIGKPTQLTCQIGLPLFGISFALCVSCILANLFQIFVGFSFDVMINENLKKLNKPVLIVMVCTGIQVSLCVIWLTLDPPTANENTEKEITILLECTTGSKEAFGAVLLYIAILAIICFLFAFKGKHLPDLYKNAKFITISMLIYLSVWILFIPVYISTSGEYLGAIKGAAILVSNYSILCCHFGPKCYIIIFKKKINVENVIVEYIRKHYENKGIQAVTSKT